MILTEKQIGMLDKDNTVVLATSSLNCQPNAVFVEVNRIKDDEIIITDNHFDLTLKNLFENPKVEILVYQEDYEYHFKIYGEAKYYSEGEYLEFVKSLESNKDFSPKGALVIKIKEIRE